MGAPTQAAELPQFGTVSKGRLWTGRVLSAIPVLLMLLSAVMKLLKLPAVVAGFAKYGLPESEIVPIGILEAACVLIYAIPRTAVLGAILVTGYLGGATLTNVRVGDPQAIIPVLTGVLVWAGLYLRDPRWSEHVPFRKGR